MYDIYSSVEYTYRKTDHLHTTCDIYMLQVYDTAVLQSK